MKGWKKIKAEGKPLLFKRVDKTYKGFFHSEGEAIPGNFWC